MEKLTVIGLDLAKNVFQVHGMDDRGRMVLGVKLKRSQVLEYFAKLPRARIGMETCCGAHEWARRLQDLGHDVKLMAPRHVKPYCMETRRMRAMLWPLPRRQQVIRFPQ